MALQSVQHIYVPSMPWGTILWNSSLEFLIDANGEKVGYFFRAPKTGSISKIHFRTGTVTTGDVIKVSLQDVDANGDPDGTPDQSGTVTVDYVDEHTWFEVTLDTSRSVTKGDKVCLVIEFDDYNAGDLSIICGRVGTSNIQLTGFCYTMIYTGSWTKYKNRLIMAAVEYSDGTVPYTGGTLPVVRDPVATVDPTGRYVGGQLKTTSDPDEVALRFSVPFKCKIDSVWCATDGNAPFDLIVYDAADVVLATTSVGEKEHGGAGSPGAGAVFLPSEVTIEADTIYRIAYKPTSTLNNRLYFFTVNSAKMMEAITGSLEFYESTRIDGGSWTDVTTQLPLLGVRISALGDEASCVTGGDASNYMENQMVDYVLNAGYDFQPENVYLALYTTNPDEDNSGTELSGNAYVRQLISFGPSENGIASNDAEIVFPVATGSWGTITHFAVFDSESGENMLIYSEVYPPATVSENNQITIGIGTLQVSID